MNQILELNTEEHWVRIQPGVVLDELNLYLKNSVYSLDLKHLPLTGAW